MQRLELLRRIYAKDRDALYGNLHMDFVCHTPGSSQIAGSFRGAEGMRWHVQQMQELTGQTFRPRHEDVFMLAGDWATVPVRLAAFRQGKTLDMRAFGVWRFADGLLAEHWEMPVDLAVFDEFWR